MVAGAMSATPAGRILPASTRHPSPAIRLLGRLDVSSVTAGGKGYAAVGLDGERGDRAVAAPILRRRQFSTSAPIALQVSQRITSPWQTSTSLVSVSASGVGTKYLATRTRRSGA